MPPRSERNNRMRRVGIKFGRIGAAQTADVAGKLDHRALHAEADAEERNLVFAGVFNRLHHAFGAALAEAARHENAVEPFEFAAAVLLESMNFVTTFVSVWMPACTSASLSDL